MAHWTEESYMYKYTSKGPCTEFHRKNREKNRGESVRYHHHYVALLALMMSCTT